MNYKLYMSGVINNIRATKTGYKMTCLFYAGYTDHEPDPENEFELLCPQNMVFPSMGIEVEFKPNDCFFKDGFAKMGYERIMEQVYVPDKIKEIPFEDVVFVSRIGVNFQEILPAVDLWTNDKEVEISQQEEET